MGLLLRVIVSESFNNCNFIEVSNGIPILMTAIKNCDH